MVRRTEFRIRLKISKLLQAMESSLPFLTLAAVVFAFAPSALHAADKLGAPVVASAPTAPPVYVGVEVIPVDAPTRALFKLPESGGMLVIGVAPGSPADGKFGQGDILLKLGDRSLVNREQLRKLLRLKKAGDTATFEISRGGRTETVAVKLAASPGALAAGFAPLNLPGFREGRVDALREQLNERARRMLEKSGFDDALLNRVLNDATVALGEDAESEGDESDGSGFALNLGDSGSGLTTMSSHSSILPEGVVTIVERDGKKSVTVKDKSGKTLVDGELDDALRAKLPAWAKPAVNAQNAPAKPEANVRSKTPVAGETGAHPPGRAAVA
jgi:hypothetical protein